MSLVGKTDTAPVRLNGNCLGQVYRVFLFGIRVGDDRSGPWILETAANDVYGMGEGKDVGGLVSLRSGVKPATPGIVGPHQTCYCISSLSSEAPTVLVVVPHHGGRENTLPGGCPLPRRRRLHSPGTAFAQQGDLAPHRPERPKTGENHPSGHRQATGGQRALPPSHQYSFRHHPVKYPLFMTEFQF